MNKHDLFRLFKSTFKNWLSDNASLRAGALTFFIILPLPSILLIVQSIFALFYGKTEANQLLIQQITSFAGPAVAQLFKTLLSSSTSPFGSVWGAVTVVAFSLGGAIGAFAVLRDTMDVVWEVKAKTKQNFSAMVRHTVGPFVVVTALGLIVIAWAGTSIALLKAITHYSINGAVMLFSIDVLQVLSTFALLTLLFALAYKLIPDAKVHWRDVAIPSLVAGLASTVTNFVIGTYVATFTVTTVIGAAGSLLIILLWIFIINEIMLFGAEMSKVYAVTSPNHAKEHLPPEAERILKPFEAAGKRIEKATKAELEEKSEAQTITQTPQAEANQPSTTSKETGKEEGTQSQLAVPSVAGLEKKENVKAESSQVKDEADLRPEPGSVEVSVVIKSARKKRKDAIS